MPGLLGRSWLPQWRSSSGQGKDIFPCHQIGCKVYRKEPPLELYGIVQDILTMSVSFDYVVFVWISRLRNINADAAAKNTLSLLEQDVVVDELIPPPN
ncbi:hypothetical protein DY000_02043517 [Brassica cretica]|uniref:RNase H type-1 domain-containing protein n=1 Tax=Brassica cretica TaxID=69181 RepID=A0ABQ7B848_BRACR|nr:hypothetical protein DY000_02043517 [Brassica cretica]